MTFYTYSARNNEGVVYQGSFEARDKLELYGHIREEGGVPVLIREKRTGSLLTMSLGTIFSGIKTHEKITLARNLGSMIGAGLSVTRALGVMEKQAKNKTLKKLLVDLAADVTKGEPLSDAMKKRPKIFSSLFISMVRAGEESGNLAGSLAVVASQMDKSYALTKKVRGAMIYPAVIICIMILIAILMLIYMVPTLTSTFQGLGITLPLSTRIIIASSDFLVHHTLIVIAAVLILAAGFTSLFQSSGGQRLMDVVSIHIPVIGSIVKEVNSARTARTLSSLLSSGVAIVVALDVTIEVLQNHLYKKALIDAREAIQKGDPMSVVFERYDYLYPVFVGEMVAVGEETGKISEMLLGVATYYEGEVEERTKDLSTIIEPLLMVFIGAGVGVFAISMLAPTYSLVNNI